MPDLPPQPSPMRRLWLRVRAVMLRGVALALPPILTIVILVWIASTVESYLLKPVEDTARQVLIWSIRDVRDDPTGVNRRELFATIDGESYARLASGEYIPADVYVWLRTNVPDARVLRRSETAYEAYVNQRYLRRSIVLPVFLCVFVLLLYFLGKLMAYGLLEFFDRGIGHLPLVRSVYASVKKITNFVFVENKVHYKRVVAVEYPRQGIWSIGLVTSDSVMEISSAAREPCVTVVLPGSPTPITGYCVMIPTRETHDLQMTIDQALQFYISCGVVIPNNQHTIVETLKIDSPIAILNPIEQSRLDPAARPPL